MSIETQAKTYTDRFTQMNAFSTTVDTASRETAEIHQLSRDLLAGGHYLVRFQMISSLYGGVSEMERLENGWKTLFNFPYGDGSPSGMWMSDEMIEKSGASALFEELRLSHS